MSALTESVVPLVVGLFGGAVGALAAPLVNWTVERRRQQFAQRRDLIASWRAGADALAPTADSGQVIQGDAFRLGIARAAFFHTFRQHASPELVSRLTTGLGINDLPTVEIVFGAIRSPLLDEVFDEIARIERNWKLV